MIVEATAQYADRSEGGCYLIYPLRANLLASQTRVDSIAMESGVYLRFVTTTEPESQRALLETAPTNLAHKSLSETTAAELSESLDNRSSLWINFDSKWGISPICGPPYGDPVPLRLLGIEPNALNGNDDLGWLHFASRVMHALIEADHLSSMYDQREELFAHPSLDGTFSDAFEEHDNQYKEMLRAFDKAVQPLVEDLRSLVGERLAYQSLEELYC